MHSTKPYEGPVRAQGPGKPSAPSPYSAPSSTLTPAPDKGEIRFSWEYFANWEFMRWLHEAKGGSGPKKLRRVIYIHYATLLIALFINAAFIFTLLHLSLSSDLGGEGSLYGTVKDESGQVVPGAEIRTDWGETIYTNDAGGFKFTHTPTGAHKFVIVPENRDLAKVTASTVIIPGENSIEVTAPSRANADVFAVSNHMVAVMLGAAAIIGVFALINVLALFSLATKKRFSYIISTLLTLPIGTALSLIVLDTALGFVLSHYLVYVLALGAMPFVVIFGLIYIYFTRDLFIAEEGESNVRG